MPILNIDEIIKDLKDWADKVAENSSKWF